MTTTDSLLSMTQSFMTPDMVQKFSRALSQSPDKIQSGLKAIVPTFLMGLVNKGSSSEGAESLVRMAKGQGATQPNVGDAHYLQKGSEAVHGIFGSNLNTVTSILATTTGLNSSSVTKMMGMIAPLVIGVLGKKISSEGMNAKGLMSFLGQQKSSLSSFMPSGLTSMFGGASTAALRSIAGSAKSVLHKSSGNLGNIPRNTYGVKKKSWVPMILLAAAVIGVIWFFTGNLDLSRIKAPAITTPPIVTAPMVTPAPAVVPATLVAADLGTLGTFFKTGNSNELPKRFSFQNLRFSSGTAPLAPGAEMELDQIAAAMKEYPSAKARIEGFTDNTGNEVSNQALSQTRSEAVKAQLVSRQIEGTRIEAVGRGSASPIAENTTEDGKALNRRIEFIATGL